MSANDTRTTPGRPVKKEPRVLKFIVFLAFVAMLLQATGLIGGEEIEL